MVLLTYDTMNELHINWTAAKLPPYNGAVAFCTYLPVYRPKGKPEHKTLQTISMKAIHFIHL